MKNLSTYLAVVALTFAFVGTSTALAEVGGTKTKSNMMMMKSHSEIAQQTRKYRMQERMQFLQDLMAARSACADQNSVGTNAFNDCFRESAKQIVLKRSIELRDARRECRNEAADRLSFRENRLCAFKKVAGVEDMKNIVELAVATDDLSTLVAAVTAGDLVDLLSADGSLTVFAPVNSAFASLDEGVLDFLLEPENQDQLVDILTYHVVPTKALSTDLEDGMEITTLGGGTLMVTINDDGVFINDAQVVTADIKASNGVVHLIDEVLIPSADDSDDVADEPTMNIVELAVATPDLSTLVTAVTEADLGDALSVDGSLTVFAPVNSAFDALDEGVLDSLLLDINQDQLVDILEYHVVPTAAFSTDLTDGMEITTLGGDVLEVTIDEDGVFINDAQVILADIEATNGVVHVIDTVLLP
jgi:transforming growth factor-beta-induced protein